MEYNLNYKNIMLATTYTKIMSPFYLKAVKEIEFYEKDFDI